MSARSKVVLGAVVALAVVVHQYGWAPIIAAAVVVSAAGALVWRVRARRVTQGRVVDLRPTVLYRHYMADGTPLYYGISNHYEARCGQHAESSWWWPLVDPARSTTQTWPGRRQAELAEAAAIRAHCPVGNCEYNHQFARQDPARRQLKALALRVAYERTAV
jgi:hypothetical protein